MLIVNNKFANIYEAQPETTKTPDPIFIIKYRFTINTLIKL